MSSTELRNTGCCWAPPVDSTSRTHENTASPADKRHAGPRRKARPVMGILRGESTPHRGGGLRRRHARPDGPGGRLAIHSVPLKGPSMHARSFTGLIAAVALVVASTALPRTQGRGGGGG